jgi:hypothetical protein
MGSNLGLKKANPGLEAPGNVFLGKASDLSLRKSLFKEDKDRY